MTTIYDTFHSAHSDATRIPTVLFVGAGPGAPDLITVRGMHLLQEADVVLYAGSLVNPALLEHCHEHCQCHDSAGMNLAEQVSLMSTAAHAGHNVVRLHTGDPAMYGAINEQMRMLSEHGVAVEIVAGVSSVFAAAAALGCELTSPEVSQSVVLTRTPGRTPMPEGEDAAAFARTGATLVFFLSTGKIDQLMQRLAGQSHNACDGGGLSPDTPAAVVYRASWPQQRILRGTISTIAKQVEEAGFGRQALIFVGQALAKNPTNSKLYDGAFSHGYRNALPRESFVGRCAVYAFSQKGTDKALEIATALQLPCCVYSQHHGSAAQSLAFVKQQAQDAQSRNSQLLTIKSLERGDLHHAVADAWDQFDAHIFVGAAGIAVRAIAPLLQNKAIDPAVLNCAESGAHIVSLCSGHLGGANRLARRVARITGGQAVISTATDGRNLPAFDEIAAAEKARIVNAHALRLCNAALLEEKTVHFYGPRAVYDANFALPTIIYMDAQLCSEHANDNVEKLQAADIPTILWDITSVTPWLTDHKNSAALTSLLALPHVLVVEAKSFVLGIGCRRGADSAAMRDRVENFLASHGLRLDHVARLATCDVKADEYAIVSMSQTTEIPVDFYTAAELSAVPVPTPSDRVASKIGTPSVCEAAALLSAGYPQAQRLFATKQTYPDMTLALARVPHGLMQVTNYTQEKSITVDENVSTNIPNVYQDMPHGGVVVVGLGSGAPSHLTPEVAEALRHCDTVAGYTPYVDFIRHLIADKKIIQNGMMGEMARCRATLQAAAEGQKVCMVCSGDAGILAMAGLLLELRHNARQGQKNSQSSENIDDNTSFADIAIKVLSGITAANIAAASLGAPLQNGFCLVSLSDLLVPSHEVRANLQSVASSALPVTLYNPAGKKRRHMLSEAIEIFRNARGNDVLCATVRHAGREQESKWLGRLADLPVDDVDMSTLVLIGGPRTIQDGDVLFEARGYADKYTLDAKKSMKSRSSEDTH
ncbi:MAG: precorrin-4 C(11)-methyltransferase [Pseudomonadota bacterium]